jgi:hypothetical protein
LPAWPFIFIGDKMADSYKLVPLADLSEYVEAPEDGSHDALLTTIRDAVESLLESQTNQEFGVAEYDREEIHDGTGTNTIYARRPIGDITDITLTYGETDSLTTLSITNTAKFRVGKRRIKTLYYIFPEGPDNIILTYDALANQPALAVQAVKEVCATLYRRIGSEDARSEDTGSFSHVLLRDISKESLLWSQAVGSLSIFPIG